MIGKIKRLFSSKRLSSTEVRIKAAEEKALIAEARVRELESVTLAESECPPPQIDASMSGWFKHDTGELIEGFKIEESDTVLDVGCGDSPFVEFCANQGPDIIIADIDSEKISAMELRLQKTSAKSVTAIVSDVNPLPIEDNSVTKVVAMEVLEHVDDPASFLKELVRVGRPGALYLITVPDPVAETVQKELAPDIYFQRPNHIRIVQRDEFEEWIKEAGLIVEERKFYGFYWSIWWMFFWACKQDLSPPWHPILENWEATWGSLLASEDGPRIKKVLDDFMPKSQAIIARKPL